MRPFPSARFPFEGLLRFNHGPHSGEPAGQGQTRWSRSSFLQPSTRKWEVKSVSEMLARRAVYLSDQGFFGGEHGLYDKRWMYEESLRIPLIMRWPGVIRASASYAEHRSGPDAGRARPGPDLGVCAGAQSGAPAAGRATQELARGHLLPLLRVPRSSPRAASLGHPHGALQGDRIPADGYSGAV